MRDVVATLGDADVVTAAFGIARGNLIDNYLRRRKVQTSWKDTIIMRLSPTACRTTRRVMQRDSFQQHSIVGKTRHARMRARAHSNSCNVGVAPTREARGEE